MQIAIRFSYFHSLLLPPPSPYFALPCLSGLLSGRFPGTAELRALKSFSRRFRDQPEAARGCLLEPGTPNPAGFHPVHKGGVWNTHSLSELLNREHPGTLHDRPYRIRIRTFAASLLLDQLARGRKKSYPSTTFGLTEKPYSDTIFTVRRSRGTAAPVAPLGISRGRRNERRNRDGCSSRKSGESSALQPPPGGQNECSVAV